jgi:hypothetical protein
MSKRTDPVRAEVNFARRKWVGIRAGRLTELGELIRQYHISVFLGDVLDLQEKWYITHPGLLRIAQRNHCSGIRSVVERELSDPASNRWVFKATVYKSPRSRGFVGYGDADPSNVSSLVHGAEMRVAETRAVNRALRKAYGIGLCSVEELGWSPRPGGADRVNENVPFANGNNLHQNGQPRLRDRLCLLIRQHKLDAGLVKAFAADYCGTATLREASRELVESFINELAERAAKDRPGLVCQLNSYAKSQEVAP